MTDGQSEAQDSVLDSVASTYRGVALNEQEPASKTRRVLDLLAAGLDSHNLTLEASYLRGAIPGSRVYDEIAAIIAEPDARERVAQVCFIDAVDLPGIEQQMSRAIRYGYRLVDSSFSLSPFRYVALMCVQPKQPASNNSLTISELRALVTEWSAVERRRLDALAAAGDEETVRGLVDKARAEDHGPVVRVNVGLLSVPNAASMKRLLDGLVNTVTTIADGDCDFIVDEFTEKTP